MSRDADLQRGLGFRERSFMARVRSDPASKIDPRSVIEKRPRSSWIARNQLKVDVGAIQPAHFSKQGFGEIKRIGQLETVTQRLSIGVQRKSFHQRFLGARR